MMLTVKLGLMAVFDAQHGGFATGWSPVSWGLIDELFVNLTMPFPRIGALPVSAVTTADVLAILTPIWHDRPETARRVRQRIGAVMKWAVAMVCHH